MKINDLQIELLGGWILISIQDLTKKYGEKTALEGVDLEIERGEIFGLLGPNGSGKSTLLRTILGLTKPREGSIEVLGFDPTEEEEEIKRVTGYVPESPQLYESLTPSELFEYIASVRRVEGDFRDRVERFVDAFEIEEEVNNDIGSLSFGMKQKISIIAALIHSPELLILDESMNGLDPKAVKVMKEFLNSYKERDRTVLYSTHVLEVAEKICDRVAIMSEGRVMSVGSVDELRDLLESPSLEDVFFKVTEEEDFAPIIKALEESL